METRHALHGVRWPASNPKCLHVDFGTESAMEKAIISTLDDAGTTRIAIDSGKDAKEFGWSRDSVKQEEVCIYCYFFSVITVKGSWTGNIPRLLTLFSVGSRYRHLDL